MKLLSPPSLFLSPIFHLFPALPSSPPLRSLSLYDPPFHIRWVLLRFFFFSFLLYFLLSPLTSRAQTGPDEVPFLFDQPQNIVYLAPYSSFTYNVTFLYNSVTVLTWMNSTSDSMLSAPSSVQYTASVAVGSTTWYYTGEPVVSVGVGPSNTFSSYVQSTLFDTDGYGSSPSGQTKYSLYTLCQMQQQLEGCTLSYTITANSTAAIVVYSIIYMKNLQYSSTLTGGLSPGSWDYYALFMQYTDLTVEVSLTPTPNTIPQQNVDLTISDQFSPFDIFFPQWAPTDDQHQPGTEEDVLIKASPGSGDSDGFQDGIYIFGVLAPKATPAPISFYTISAVSNYSSESFFGLSMFGIIAALVILVLCLCSAAAVIIKRRRAHIQQFNDIIRDSNGALMLVEGRLVLNPAMLPTPPGATPEQIAALPKHTYIEGESHDDKCSICLDTYIPGESIVKKLPCGHIFHSEGCIDSWLEQKKHCPLCQQDIDAAIDVARHSLLAVNMEEEEDSIKILPTTSFHSHPNATIYPINSSPNPHMSPPSSIDPRANRPSPSTLLVNTPPSSTAPHPHNHMPIPFSPGEDDEHPPVEIQLQRTSLRDYNVVQIRDVEESKMAS